MNIEQARQFKQDLKRTLQDSGISDLKRKLKSMSLTEQFPGLTEVITKAAEAQETLAHYQPPKPMTLGPLHNDEAERK